MTHRFFLAVCLIVIVLADALVWDRVFRGPREHRPGSCLAPWVSCWPGWPSQAPSRSDGSKLHECSTIFQEAPCLRSRVSVLGLPIRPAPG